MRKPNILFISGSVGLGHVTRDLAIAAALRTRCPGLRLLWLAADPARQVLREAGEEIAPQSAQYAGETPLAEGVAGYFSLHLTNPVALLRHPIKLCRSVAALIRDQKNNLTLLRQLAAQERFDLIIGDEIYDIMLALARRPDLKPAPLAMIYDFVGVEALSRSRIERLSVQMANWYAYRVTERLPRFCDLTLFMGEPEDVADKPLG